MGVKTEDLIDTARETMVAVAQAEHQWRTMLGQGADARAWTLEYLSRVEEALNAAKLRCGAWENN